MDDIGTILYLVFAVIAAVFSMIKKNNQKKNANAPTTSAEPESGDVLGDILPEFKRLFQQPDVAPVPESHFEPEPELLKKPEAKPKDISIEEKKRQLDRMSTINTKAKRDLKTAKRDIASEGLNTEDSWFNAREAIIYSEILKRPEY